MDGKASESVILRDRDGLYWLQAVDTEGRWRSCYLGHLRRPHMVRCWCELRAVPFYDGGPKERLPRCCGRGSACSLRARAAVGGSGSFQREPCRGAWCAFSRADLRWRNLSGAQGSR